MAEVLIALGDLHLNWQAGKLIFDKARSEGINTALTLGDEAHKIYPFDIGDPEDYERLYDEMRQFRDELPERRLICVIGDKTAGVPKDLVRNFAGVSAKGIIESLTWAEDNMIAGHNGEHILKEHKDRIQGYDSYEPLVIFHGHSHSMGVLPEYKWLKDSEKVDWLTEEKMEYKLEPRKVYWVNPGGNFFTNEQGLSFANFAVYDRTQQSVTLNTVVFDRAMINPTARRRS